MVEAMHVVELHHRSYTIMVYAVTFSKTSSMGF